MWRENALEGSRWFMSFQDWIRQCRTSQMVAISFRTLFYHISRDSILKVDPCREVREGRREYVSRLGKRARVSLVHEPLSASPNDRLVRSSRTLFPTSTSSHSCNIRSSPVQTQYHLQEDDYQRGEPRWVVVLVPPVDPLQRAGPVACPSPRFNRRKGAANTWRKNHYCAVSELLPSWSGSAFTEIFKSCRLLLFRPRRSLGV